jgi:hypothetical protein
MSDKPSPAGERKPPKRRKPYARPVLQRYGAIRSITQDVGSMGGVDGGANPKTKSMT